MEGVVGQILDNFDQAKVKSTFLDIQTEAEKFLGNLYMDISDNYETLMRIQVRVFD